MVCNRKKNMKNVFGNEASDFMERSILFDTHSKIINVWELGRGSDFMEKLQNYSQYISHK